MQRQARLPSWLLLTSSLTRDLVKLGLRLSGFEALSAFTVTEMEKHEDARLRWGLKDEEGVRFKPLLGRSSRPHVGLRNRETGLGETGLE